MQFLDDKALFLDQLYRGNRNITGQRNGFGIQLFLNGFQYVGNWKNNLADGYGVFIHNDGTFRKGLFENHFFKDGEVRYYNGAHYHGTIDKINESFDLGILKCINGHILDLKWRNGKIIRGNVKLASENKNYPKSFDFDFTKPLNNEKWLTDDKAILIEGESGLYIKFNGTYVYEGTISNGQKSGLGYKYFSPNKYHEKWYINNNFLGEGLLVDIEEYKQQKVNRTLVKIEIIDKMFYSGFHVQRYTKDSYMINIKYIKGDFIKPDEPLNPDVLLCSELILPSGTYNYLGENRTYNNIKFNNLKRIEHVSFILDKRIHFDIISKSIQDENPNIKHLINELFTKEFVKHRLILNNDIQHISKELDYNIIGALNSIKNPDSTLTNNVKIPHSNNTNENYTKNHSIYVGNPSNFQETEYEYSSRIRLEKVDNRKIVTTNQIQSKIISVNGLINESNTEFRHNNNNAYREHHNNIIPKDTNSVCQDNEAPDTSHRYLNGNKNKEDSYLSNNRENVSNIYDVLPQPVPVNLGFDIAPSNRTLKQPLSISRNKTIIKMSKKSKINYQVSQFKLFGKPSTIINNNIDNVIEERNNTQVTSDIFNGIVYFKGAVYNYLYQGECELHYKDGSKFKGNFLDGRKQGQGQLEKNGVLYIGDYVDNLPSGTFKRIENGQEKLGVFKNDEFIARITKKINGLTVEVYENGSETLNGKFLVKLQEYDLECYFDNNQLIKKQKDCILKNINDHKMHIGKLYIVHSGDKAIFKSHLLQFFLIDIRRATVDKYGNEQ